MSDETYYTNNKSILLKFVIIKYLFLKKVSFTYEK